MKKRIALVLAFLPFAFGIFLYRFCDAWEIIEMAARLHSETGSVNCGHVTNSTYHGETTAADAAIKCAQDALEHHRAFRVVFTGYGIDETISNALVVESQGNGI